MLPRKWLVLCCMVLAAFAVSFCEIFLGAGFSGQGKTPNDIPGNILWLRADKGVKAGVGCPGGGDAVSGQYVGCWEDQSRLGNSASATTGPIFFSNGLNSKPRLSFATQTMMGTIPLSDDNTIFVVFWDASIGPDIPIVQISSFSLLAQNGRIGFTIDGTTVSSNQYNTQPIILSVTKHIQNLKVSGVYCINGATQFYEVNSGFPSGSYNLGGGNSAHDLYEIIAFNRVLSEQERHEIELYLSKKYAIPLAN